MTHGVVLRSPHAHARIRAIRAAAAAAMPGVLSVYTAADLIAAKLGDLPVGWIVRTEDGAPMARPPHPVLATERVRHVGDPAAFVVAETRAAALDALEKIEVDYEVLPPWIDLETSVLGNYDPATDRYTLYASNQNPHVIRVLSNAQRRKRACAPSPPSSTRMATDSILKACGGCWCGRCD